MEEWKERLGRLIDALSGLRIAVLGDFILDEFLFGEIARVSREAPVLILRYRETLRRPGGGANTVANLEALGVRAVPVGFVGDDEWADRLVEAWSRRPDTRFLFRGPHLSTSRKTRILAGSQHSFRQQVVRVDYESPANLQAGQESQIVSALVELLPEAAALVVSDYSLGNVTPPIWTAALETARRHSRPVVVDSRDRPHQFRGATSATPNISEVEAALGRRIEPAQLSEVAARVRRDWELEALLITLGRFGMQLVEEYRSTEIPAFGSDEAVDVTGAGDTVIAVYTASLAAGASYEEAARLANLAGGLVVMKRGTATVTPEELRTALAEA